MKKNKKEEKRRREGGQAREGTERRRKWRESGEERGVEPLCSRGFKVKLEEFKRIQSTYLYCTL